MKIGEVEEKTGITRKNIRFYEQQGLLQPARGQENRYREYTEADVKVLKEIKLLRRLGVPIADIQALQKGYITLEDAMKKHTLQLEQQLKETENALAICGEIKGSGQSLETLPADEYLQQMEKMERKGARFTDIARDFAQKAKDMLPPSASYSFEPSDPITNPREFTDELIAFAQRENLDLTILKEGMCPVVELDGVRYMGMLEIPRMLHFPLSIFFAPRSYGFRFAYLYRV